MLGPSRIPDEFRKATSGGHPHPAGSLSPLLLVEATCLVTLGTTCFSGAPGGKMDDPWMASVLLRSFHARPWVRTWPVTPFSSRIPCDGSGFADVETVSGRPSPPGWDTPQGRRGPPNHFSVTMPPAGVPFTPPASLLRPPLPKSQARPPCSLMPPVPVPFICVLPCPRLDRTLQGSLCLSLGGRVCVRGGERCSPASLCPLIPEGLTLRSNGSRCAAQKTPRAIFTSSGSCPGTGLRLRGGGSDSGANAAANHALRQ